MPKFLVYWLYWGSIIRGKLTSPKSYGLSLTVLYDLFRQVIDNERPSWSEKKRFEHNTKINLI